jgi:hypothetical protein
MFDLRIKTLTMLCSVALAGGCGFLKQTTSAQSSVTPVTKVSHSDSVSDPDYELGRLYQGRMQYEAAIAAYRKSLKLNPGNAEAHNALGVIYASLGRHEQAVAELMAASALSPSAAHIHNNLGYAYLLRGRNVEAAAALRVARDLDPASPRSRENMKAAERALARGTQPLDGPALVSPESIVTPAVEKRSEPSSSKLISLAPNIFELREPPRQPLNADVPLALVQPMKAAVPPTPADRIAARLEVSNGSGVTGLAKRTSTSLQKRGYVVNRLTNQIPYTQTTTEIQYRPGEQTRAAQLNALLSQPAKLVESSRLSPIVVIRVVLGRDAGRDVLFTGNASGETVVAGL